MQAWGLTYFPGVSAVHRCDARAKVALLLAFSIGVFLVRTWWGMGALAVLVGALLALARVPAGAFARMMAPVLVLAAFSWLFNAVASPGWQGVAAGAFFAVRMVVLVAGSFVVCLTTASTALVDAFAWYIGPLRRVRVPVDDIAFTLALSLRFIPVIEGELHDVRTAQRARGAEAAGSPWRRLRIWGAAFAALFVGLFRHADDLACAMDSRCYGAAPHRTRLPKG